MPEQCSNCRYMQAVGSHLECAIDPPLTRGNPQGAFVHVLGSQTCGRWQGALTVVLVDGTGQSVPAGDPVPVQPSVLLTDPNGLPVEGILVIFAVVVGPSTGKVTGGVVHTGIDGVAMVGSWITDAAPAGTNNLTATVEGDNVTGNPVAFTAEGT